MSITDLSSARQKLREFIMVSVIKVNSLGEYWSESVGRPVGRPKLR